MAPPPSILHVDMDAFFASVEQLDQPELKGKPVLVGYDGPRGVVAAASYEARRFGCHSAQPMAAARECCPQAVIVPVHMERYREISDRVFAIFEAHTPLVEPLSIDEAFLDIAGTERLLGDAVSIARSIRARIHDELHLTASVGVAPNKFLAKLASDMCKPDGLKVILADEIDLVLPALPVGKLWGIGPKSAARLGDIGIRTIGDLRKLPPKWFDRQFGTDGQWFRHLAFGEDDRVVTPDREAKSIGHEQTFEIDIPDPQHVREVLLGQVEQVGRRLRRHGLRARVVGLKIRFGRFQTITRARTLASPTDVTNELWTAARELFDQWAIESFQPVRLIGMTARDLSTGAGQLELFTNPAVERQRKLDQVMDGITQRFGNGAVRRGGPRGLRKLP